MIQIEIIPQSAIEVEIINTQIVDVEIESDIVPVGDYEQYKGDYLVVPKFENQTLETKDKVMGFNVEIKPIPVEKVANTSGGNTVIIGS